jgi:hypothetical protein
LYNEELHKFVPLNWWTGYVANTEEKKNSYRILVEKSEEKRALQRPTLWCYDNIIINHREIGLGVT